MHKIDQFSDDRLSWGLWLGIVGGILWSWVRYTATYGLIFVLGEWFFFRRLAYYPRLTPVDQGLTMASILLPVAGDGGSYWNCFFSDKPGGPLGRPSIQQRDPEGGLARMIQVALLRTFLRSFFSAGALEF